MRFWLVSSLVALYLSACAPVDSEVYGIKKQTVAYEKLPIERTPTQVINMNNKVRIVVNSNRLFTDSSAKFNVNYRTLLLPLENFFNSHKMPKHIVVSGYQSYNSTRSNKLSKLQAEALASYIWALGMPSDIIKVTAYGGKYPVSDSSTASGNIDNRRINVDIY